MTLDVGVFVTELVRDSVLVGDRVEEAEAESVVDGDTVCEGVAVNVIVVLELEEEAADVESDDAVVCVASAEGERASVTLTEGDEDCNEDIVAALALGDAEATVVTDEAPHCTGPSATPP